jgi:transmembrane sensor
MDAISYQLSELLSDDSFIRWIKEIEGADTQRWANWLAAHPQNPVIAAEARRFLESIRTREQPVSDREIREQLARVLKRIDRSPSG